METLQPLVGSHLSFTAVQAGRCTNTLQTSAVDLYHVLGNHCLAIPRDRMLKDLHMPYSYYSKQLPCAWKLIALDTTELSGHSQYPLVWPLLLHSMLSVVCMALHGMAYYVRVHFFRQLPMYQVQHLSCINQQALTSMQHYLLHVNAQLLLC